MSDDLFRPQPEVWLDDFTLVMHAHTTPVLDFEWVRFGNFWAPRPCRRNWLRLGRGHDWLRLRGPDHDGRSVYRCQRCGSQLRCPDYLPPPYGKSWTE